MREWFGNLDRMMNGSITLAMTYNDDRPIMPGEVIGFLGGQFYVEGISHSWNYGQGGDINLSVSRGGDYDKGGKFHPFNGISEKINLLENKMDEKHLILEQYRIYNEIKESFINRSFAVNIF